ncbi:DUF262 domain-containing protein [Brachyspira pilosicoli]|uniref:DUF262 domain-containing protein n=1 Tax=Brachyspira pilosicoli TaxID=52584 RepID=UPI00300406E4
MSYKSDTIRNIINGIHEKKYVLPAIQREFVWKYEQIINLFDSILRGYPIGSFLFWNIEKDKINNYIYYDFIKDYHEKDCRHNPKHEIIRENNIISILDGQQRLTSLYIGLKGSYSYKEKYKKKNLSSSFPKRELYINLFRNTLNNDDNDLLYELKFLTEKESKNNDNNYHWFKVAEILNMSTNEISIFSIENGIDEEKNPNTEKQKNILTLLNNMYNVFCQQEIINYYEEKEQDIEKVLNIFTRINRGGTILNYSDLLLSTSTALWQKYDAREEINNLVDKINNIGIYVNKDFIMKASLVLSDLDIAFKVKNFNKDNTQIIENNWEIIKEFLIRTAYLIINMNYKGDVISSHNALLPIAYYLKKNKYDDKFLSSKNYQKDREIIKKWFTKVLIAQSFGGASDTVLAQCRNIIKDSKLNEFPINTITEKLKNTSSSISFNDEKIENLIDDSYFGNTKTFLILILIQDMLPNNIELSVDHIHPQNSFNKSLLETIFNNNNDDMEHYKHNIVNLEILSTSINSAKGDKPLEEWMETDDGKRYSYLIPKDLIDYKIENIFEFYEKRRKLLIEKLKEKLL